MGLGTENGYMKYGNCTSSMSKKWKKTRETTQMVHFVEKDDVLRQAYYKYAREDGHHPENYRVLKVLYEIFEGREATTGNASAVRRLA